MQLNPRNVFPENNTMHFAVDNYVREATFWTPGRISQGFVGIVLFLDGKWYSMPNKQEVPVENDFSWVTL